MFMTVGQDDSNYFAVSIACAVLLFIFIITAKSLDQELRKPLVALLVSALAGIVIFISKAIPMLVIGVLCLGFLIAIVRNVIRLHHVSHQDIHYPASNVQTQPLVRQPSLVHIGSLKALWPVVSIVVVVGFFSFIYLLFNKDGFMNVMGSMHSTPSSVSTAQLIAPAPIVSTQPTKIDAKHDLAIQAYQQARIDHQTSLHAVEAEWGHLSKSISKANLGSWIKSQQAWSMSKRHVCGVTEDAQEISTITAAELKLRTKALRCDTEANRNRASYIKNSVAAMMKGHLPTDDLGNLIQSLHKQ